MTPDSLTTASPGPIGLCRDFRQCCGVGVVVPRRAPVIGSVQGYANET
jgi:hypothetical protein